MDDLVNGATPGKNSKSVQYQKSGGIDEANADFDSLTKGVDVKDQGNGIRSATLSDGRTISVRPNSNQGSATIQISPAKGNPGKKTKVRYDE